MVECFVIILIDADCYARNDGIKEWTEGECN